VRIPLGVLAAQAVSVPLTPLEIFGADLIQWSKSEEEAYSDAGTTPAVDGQGVWQWGDLSGSGNHWLQASSPDRPYYRATRFSNKPSLHLFSSEYMATAVSLGGTTLTAFLLGRIDGALNANGRILAFQATGDATDWQLVSSAVILQGMSTTELETYRAGRKATGVPPLDFPVRLGSIFNGTHHNMHIEGTPQTQVASTGTFGSTGTLGLGASPTGGNNIGNLLVAETIVVKRSPTAPELAQLNSYLESRWEEYARPVVTTIALQYNNEGTKLAVPLEVLEDYESITWSIVGGAQSANFEISGSLLRRVSDGVSTYTGSDEAVVVRATGDDTGLTRDHAIAVRVGELNAGAAKDIVLSSDYGADADDAAGLGGAIKRHIDGLVNILAVVSSSKHDASAGAIRATLDHYGLTGVPVGAYQGELGGDATLYAEEIRDEFGTPGISRRAFVDSKTLYRQIAATASRDFTIISIGGLGDLAEFRQSAADAISASTGNTLATNAVELLVVMGGDYPNGTNEYNLSRHAPSSKDIGDNWPTPVVWHGVSIGNGVNSGAPLGVDPATDPIARAYQINGGGTYPSTRPSWDPLAVLYGIDGAGSHFGMGGSNGTNTIDNTDGDNAWTSTAGNDSYVSKVSSDVVLSSYVDEILDALITDVGLFGSWEIGGGIASHLVETGVHVLTEDSGASEHYVKNLAIPHDGFTSYVWTFKMRDKPSEAARNIVFEVFLAPNTGGQKIAGIVSLQDGGQAFTAASPGFVATSIVPTSLGDGWWDVEIKFGVPAAPDDAIDAFLLIAHVTNGTSYSGDGEAGVEYYDNKLEVDA
jgi:hypothetical protein